jgi:transposase-like protein
MKCKKCNKKNIVKNGTQEGIQRYKCKSCCAVFRGKEPKYSAEFKIEVIKMYLNSVGVRAIGRIKGIHNSVISVWIKKIGSIIKEKLYSEMEKVQEENIQIMEIDELFTYIKKEKIENIYIVVSTENQVKLLMCK